MKKKAKPCYAAKGLPQVPGKPKGTDIVPAWLTPGEAILSPAAAEMLGRGNVQRLNQQAMRLGTPQYKAMGGMVDDAAKEAEAKRITGNPDQYNMMQVQAAEAFMQQQRNPQEPQYFMGGTAMVPRLGTVQPGYYAAGTGMVLGTKPMYLADGMTEIERKNRQFVNNNNPEFDPGTGGSWAAETRRAIGPPLNPIQSRETGSPGGMYQMQPAQPSQPVKNEDFVNRSLPQFMREEVGPTARAALGAVDRFATAVLPGVGAPLVANPDKPGMTYQGPTLGTRLQEGLNAVQDKARGLMNSNVAAADRPSTGNAMSATSLDDYLKSAQQPNSIAPPNRVGVTQPTQSGGLLQAQPASKGSAQPTPLGRVGDDRLFADQASADAARSKIEADMKQPGYAPPRIVDDAYPQNQGGLYANRAQVPGYLATMAKDRAATPQPAALQPTMQQPRLGNPAIAQSRPTVPDDGSLRAAVANGRMGPMTDEQKAFQEYAGRQYQLMEILRYSPDEDRVRAAAAGLGGAFNYNPGFPQAEASKLNSNLDYSAKMRELDMGQPLINAQAQESLGKGNYYQSEADMQNAMLQDPERYAGMRLGSRGVSQQPDSPKPQSLDLSEGNIMMLGQRAFQRDPESGALTEVAIPQQRAMETEQSLLDKMKAQGIKEGSSKWNDLLSRFRSRLGIAQ